MKKHKRIKKKELCIQVFYLKKLNKNGKKPTFDKVALIFQSS